MAACCGLVGCQAAPLLYEAEVSPALITPNGDGQSERARLSFRLRRDAEVGILLEAENGDRFTLRPPTALAGRSQPYSVEFSGIVEGYTLPGEAWAFEILQRMIPDGVYTWRIRGGTATGETAELTGTLTVRDADSALPGLVDIELEPEVITPNQDGINDWGAVRLRLTKDVEMLSVTLIGADGAPFPLYEQDGVTPPNAAGPHAFVYNSLVYPHKTPGDGSYPIVIEARDSMGQHVRAVREVTLAETGRLNAYIDLGQVLYSGSTVPLSETLCFTLTVLNAGETFIRTTGPWPGTDYTMSENFTTLGWPEDEGVFRIAMDHQGSKSAYPFRWGIGTPGLDLVERNGHWYLPPGARGVVTGCLQMDRVPTPNPLYIWMGLLHEQGRLPLVNHRVAPLLVTVEAR